MGCERTGSLHSGGLVGNWGRGREMGTCLELQDIRVFIYTGGLQMTQGTVIRRRRRKARERRVSREWVSRWGECSAQGIQKSDPESKDQLVLKLELGFGESGLCVRPYKALQVNELDHGLSFPGSHHPWVSQGMLRVPNPNWLRSHSGVWAALPQGRCPDKYSSCPPAALHEA